MDEVPRAGRSTAGAGAGGGTRRRLLRAGGALGAAGGVGALLTACGQGAKPGGGDGAGLAPGRDPVTVSVWHQNWASPEAETRSRAMLTELQERLPRVRVDWQVVAWAGAGQMVARLPVAAASGDLPDTFRSHWSIHGSIIHQGWVRPLDDYWKQAGLGRKDFTPSAWDLTVSRGRSYGVPSSAYTIAFLWNRGLLAASGLPGDRPPDTFEALMEASSRVQRVVPAPAGADGASAGGGPGAIEQLGWTHRSGVPGHFPFLFGGLPYDAARERVTPDHPGIVAALEWSLALLKRQGGYQRVEQFWKEAGASPMGSGRVGFATAQPRGLEDPALRTSGLNLGLGLFPGAPGKGGARANVENTTVQTEIMPITAASKHPDETWAVLRWLFVEQAAEWGLRSLMTPNRLSALDAFYERLGAGMGVGQGALAGIDLGAYKEIARRGTRAWPTIPTANEYLTALTAAWNDVLQEKAAPEAALREVGRLQQAELEQALQRK
ncbi:MAG TPA: extracellular solute-binding protein [Chloroflexota bacterium]|nr:extracellular solute-binding protein [Chloroflexota bacterium]